MNKTQAKPVAKTAPKAAVKTAVKTRPASEKAAPSATGKAAPSKTPPQGPVTPGPKAATTGKTGTTDQTMTKPEVTTAPTPPAKAPSPRAMSKTAAARAAVQPPTQLPSPAPFANRFTDRFAPARAPARPTDTEHPLRAAHKPNPKLVNAWKSKAGRELSEEELLAMPEAEYMNDKQLDFFKACLQGQRDDLLSNAGETTEHLREDTSIVPDPADRATIEEEHALELRTRDRERKLLKKIAQSLTRVENNEYGFCDETGEPIGLARLLARPTATLSLEAQQRRELKQKMFGD